MSITTMTENSPAIEELANNSEQTLTGTSESDFTSLGDDLSLTSDSSSSNPFDISLKSDSSETTDWIKKRTEEFKTQKNEYIVKNVNSGEFGSKTNIQRQLLKTPLSEMKSPVTLWYPHVFEKDMKKTEQNELEKYGAYVFDIAFYPEYEKNDLNVAHSIAADVFSGKEGILTGAIELLGQTFNAGLKIINGVLETFQDSNFSNTATAIDSTSQSALSKLFVNTPMDIYKDKTSINATIYLPLNNIGVKRSSGIKEEEAVTNLGTKYVKQIAEALIGNKSIGSTLSAGKGIAINKFYAPRLVNPNLDTRSFKWELIPRTEEEQYHISLIISFFAFLSVPTFAKGDLIFNMPPLLKMKALTSEIDDDLNFNQKILIPEREYYLSEFAVRPSFSDESVMLDEHGNPIGITLEITLIKNNLETAKDLFINPYL